MKCKQRFVLLLCFMMTFSLMMSAIASAAPTDPLQGITRTQIFPDSSPIATEHNHGSSIVELHDGTLFMVFFSGDGERDGDTTKIMGARSKDGGKTWTPPFDVYDTHDFPDINPVVYVDQQSRLWLFYNVVLNGQWVSAQPKYMYADIGSYEYTNRTGGNPKWHYPQTIYMNVGDAMSGKGSYSNGQWTYRVKGSEIKSLSPSQVTAATYLDPSKYVEVTSWFNSSDKRYVTDSFVVSMKRKYEQYIQYLQMSKPYDDVYTGRTQEIINSLQNGIYTVSGATYSKYEPPIIQKSIERASGADNDISPWNPTYSRLGWETKNKPIEIQYNNKTRLILPLYSDSLSNSVVVYTDNRGETWQISDAIVGSGTIQGSLIQLKNDHIRAYFRSGKLDGKNGRLAWHTTYSESKDGGATWGVPVVDPYLKNDGGFEVAKLPNGDWLAATNQETKRDAQQSGHRSTYSLLLSKDEGQSWKSILMESDPTTNETYQYPGVLVDKLGNALMTYSLSSSSPKFEVMGFARTEAPEIEKLFGSVINATYGAQQPVINNKLNLPVVGNSKQLTFTLTVDGDVKTDGGVTWSSDDTSVATIDSTGNVIAKKTGTALITVVSRKYGTIYKCLVSVGTL
jgi:predicted neuraminidase